MRQEVIHVTSGFLILIHDWRLHSLLFPNWFIFRSVLSALKPTCKYGWAFTWSVKGSDQIILHRLFRKVLTYGKTSNMASVMGIFLVFLYNQSESLPASSSFWKKWAAAGVSIWHNLSLIFPPMNLCIPPGRAAPAHLHPPHHHHTSSLLLRGFPERPAALISTLSMLNAAAKFSFFDSKLTSSWSSWSTT